MTQSIRAEEDDGRRPGHDAISGADVPGWATDREAWLRLAADWKALAEDMMRRRDHI